MSSIAQSAMFLATGKEVHGLDAMERPKPKRANAATRANAPVRRRLTPAAILKVIPGTFGNQSEIARRLGVKRETVAGYIDRFPEVKAAFEQERESAIDFAESRLMSGINSGDPESIRFFLRTIGRKRGYNERMEVTGQNGGAIIVKLTPEDAQG